MKSQSQVTTKWQNLTKIGLKKDKYFSQFSFALLHLLSKIGIEILNNKNVYQSVSNNDFSHSRRYNNWMNQYHDKLAREQWHARFHNFTTKHITPFLIKYRTTEMIMHLFKLPFHTIEQWSPNCYQSLSRAWHL